VWLEKFQEQQGMLRLEYDSFEFYGDLELLKDAVSNLLSNALKYQHPQHKLRCILAIKEYGTQMEISVTDNGMGVPIADRKRIFDRFVRIEGNHRGLAGGHGLGLAFVAETAEAHHGTVKCVDGIQTGSKFVLRIPLRHSLQTTWKQRIPWMKKQKK
jgi:signal transduction histidine kinase